MTNTRSGSAVPARCMTCEVLQQAPLACSDCHQLLSHVQGADYFELFGLPRAYQIDEAALAETYRAISRNIHPDKFAGGDSAMASFALRASAAVNQAYDVLKDPFRRAEYLLETSGGKSSADDKRVPQDLLGRVMMWREEIDEATSSSDDATLSEIRKQVGQLRKQSQSRVEELCPALADDRDETKDALRLELNAMKYLNNLMQQLD